MDLTQARIGMMVKTARGLHGLPPDTFGVVCDISHDHVLIAWHLCDKPLPNLTPQSIAALEDDDPRCPLRDRLPLETAAATLQPA